ncbi:hypothetical protein Vau01_016430 [Virgisporangium aurantiacum]|uniref:Uncharacterized protein n=1 Tax=Virgisporangium aurantiacum TaxID=175570 RepID=A0A8J3Z0M4_9ACTN|nr:hypothetical protein Vau01_016430 [Virgisporangium aurantiacum]
MPIIAATEKATGSASHSATAEIHAVRVLALAGQLASPQEGFFANDSRASIGARAGTGGRAGNYQGEQTIGDPTESISHLRCPFVGKGPTVELKAGIYTLSRCFHVSD